MSSVLRCSGKVGMLLRDEFLTPLRYYKVRIDANPSASLEWRYTVNEFASNVERHRRELLLHCYRMLGSLPDAEDAVQESLLRAWRYRDSLKEGAPLRPWLYRVATNACLDAIARDERGAVLGARAEADDGWAGQPDDVVWLGPIPDSVLEPPAPPTNTPEAMTLMRETIEIARYGDV